MVTLTSTPDGSVSLPLDGLAFSYILWDTGMYIGLGVYFAVLLVPQYVIAKDMRKRGKYLKKKGFVSNFIYAFTILGFATFVSAIIAIVALQSSWKAYSTFESRQLLGCKETPTMELLVTQNDNFRGALKMATGIVVAFMALCPLMWLSALAISNISKSEIKSLVPIIMLLPVLGIILTSIMFSRILIVGNTFHTISSEFGCTEVEFSTPDGKDVFYGLRLLCFVFLYFCGTNAYYILFWGVPTLIATLGNKCCGGSVDDDKDDDVEMKDPSPGLIRLPRWIPLPKLGNIFYYQFDNAREAVEDRIMAFKEEDSEATESQVSEDEDSEDPDYSGPRPDRHELIVKQKLRKGKKCRAYWEAKGQWVVARIKQVNVGGTYDLEYFKIESDQSNVTRHGPPLLEKTAGSESKVSKSRIQLLHQFKKGQKVVYTTDFGDQEIATVTKLIQLGGFYELCKEGPPKQTFFNIDQENIKPIGEVPGLLGFTATEDGCSFDFRHHELPGGVTAVGNIRLADNPVTNTSMVHMQKGAYLKVPMPKDATPDQGFQEYTLSMEIRLNSALLQQGRMSLFNASWPEVQDGNQLEIVSDPQGMILSVPGCENGGLCTNITLKVGKWYHISMAVNTGYNEVVVTVDGQKAHDSDELTLQSVEEGEGDHPYTVNKGILLFASNAFQHVPGNVTIRHVNLEYSMKTRSEMHAQYRKSKSKKARSKVSKRQETMPVLAPLLGRKAPPMYRYPSYLSETINPFMREEGGDMGFLPHYQMLCFTLHEMMKSTTHTLPYDHSIYSKLVSVYNRAYPLLHWVDKAKELDPQARVGLIPKFIEELKLQRQLVPTGEPLIMPLGYTLKDGDWQYILVIFQKTGTPIRRTYRLVVCDPEAGFEWQETSPKFHPKMKSRSAMVFEDVMASKAEDDLYWHWVMAALLGDNEVQTARLYDILLSGLLGEPLGARLAKSHDKGDFRSQSYSPAGAWRCYTVATHWMLRSWLGLNMTQAKMFKFGLRKQMLSLALSDVQNIATSLEESEAQILRLGIKQLAYSAVKGHYLASKEKKAVAIAMANMELVEEMSERLEQLIVAKPPVIEDATQLPLIDVQSWNGAECLSQEQQTQGWCLHPLFDRLIRRDVRPGAPDSLPPLLTVDFLRLPTKISSFSEVLECLRRVDDICGQLNNLHNLDRCKFGPFLITSLLQHTFTVLLPLPFGPTSVTPGLDQVWSPDGFFTAHPTLTRNAQIDALLMLRRLMEFAAIAFSCINAAKEFDAVRIVTSGAIATVADRILRMVVVHTDGPAQNEPLESDVTLLLNDAEGHALGIESFLVQSETIEFYSPELSVARSAIANYFEEVRIAVGCADSRERIVFDWDHHGWMMWVNQERGTSRLFANLAQKRYLKAKAPLLVTGQDPFVLHSWPELECYRDIVFWWKYFCCTDRRVFPYIPSAVPLQAGLLSWKIATEQQVFQSPPNRGHVYQVSALGKEHVLTTGEMSNRPEPPINGHRWPSFASPSYHTSPNMVRCEDDLLYLRTLPDFNQTLRPSDSELLLSYLTAPLLRQPLLLAFFCTRDRVNLLREKKLQKILEAALFEPHRLLFRQDLNSCPRNVPAVGVEIKYVATSHGILISELRHSPAVFLGYIRKLLELTLILANSATSEMTGVILFACRIAARVESHIKYLVQHAEAEPSNGGSDDTHVGLEELLVLRKSWRKLRACFDDCLDRLGLWVEELLEAAAEDPELEDQNMIQCCNIHAHAMLLLRNVESSTLQLSHVKQLMSSFMFISLRHTWNCDYLDIPEPELFEIYHQHRRNVVTWFEQARGRYSDFNGVLRAVHSQFAMMQIKSTGSSVTSVNHFQWGAIADAVPGRYVLVGKEERGKPREVPTISAEEQEFWVELDIQVLQVIIRGQHVQPLETSIAQNPDVGFILKDEKQTSTMQSAVVLNASNVNIRDLVSRPFRLNVWTDFVHCPHRDEGYDRPYDPEDMSSEELWILELFEPVRNSYFVAPKCGKEDIPFYMHDDVCMDSCAIVRLLGVQPPCHQNVINEIVIFREHKSVHVYGICGYGHQIYRALEYTSNCKVTLRGLQPSPGNQQVRWPAWARHAAGDVQLNLKGEQPGSVCIARTSVKASQFNFSADLTANLEPLLMVEDDAISITESDVKEKSDLIDLESNPEPTPAVDSIASDGPEELASPELEARDDNETHSFTSSYLSQSIKGYEEKKDEEKKDEDVVEDLLSEHSNLDLGEIFDLKQKQGEQFLPKRLLLGLIPDALLESYHFYQNNQEHTIVHGYLIDLKTGLEIPEHDIDHFLYLKLYHLQTTRATGLPGWCGMITKHHVGGGGGGQSEDLVLLDLLYAKEGTPLHSVAHILSRLEDLSHVLAWTKRPNALSEDPAIKIIQLPRLQLSFECRVGPNGEVKLWSIDYAKLFVPSGPPSKHQRKAQELLRGMPHGIILASENEEYFIVVPNVMSFRPGIGNSPFSTSLVLLRNSNNGWEDKPPNTHYLYPVHVSLAFALTPTLGSALYWLLLQLQNRNYLAAEQLVKRIGTDRGYTPEEKQIFSHLASVSEAHPDAHAIRLKISLVSYGIKLRWNICNEMFQYLSTLSHVSGQCRLSDEEECGVTVKCLARMHSEGLVEKEVAILRAKNPEEFRLILEMMSDDDANLEASQQQAKLESDWIKRIANVLRANRLLATTEDIQDMIRNAVQDIKTHPKVKLAIENRAKYLHVNMPETPTVQIRGYDRPEESYWMFHSDKNVIFGTAFDLCLAVLGPEKLRTKSYHDPIHEVSTMGRAQSVNTAVAIVQQVNVQERLQFFVTFYSLFTRTTRLKLDGKGVSDEHQHSFTQLLLNTLPGSRIHGVLPSVLHILSHNPGLCKEMPKLTMPRKVKSVGQMIEKLMEVHETLMGFHVQNRITWPPTASTIESLGNPAAEISARGTHAAAIAAAEGGLCHELVFGLKPMVAEVPLAVNFRPPYISGSSCDSRTLSPGPLTGGLSLSPEDLATFASKPMYKAGHFVRSACPPATQMSPDLPFDLSSHPAIRHPLAAKAMARMTAEMKTFSAMYNAGTIPGRENAKLVGVSEEDVDAVVQGDIAKLHEIIKLLKSMHEKIWSLKRADTDILATGIETLKGQADCIPFPEGQAKDPSKIKYRLLRLTGHESTFWFEYMCRLLLSPNNVQDWKRLNPFLNDVETLENLLTSSMFHALRIVQANRTLEQCTELLAMLESITKHQGPVDSLEHLNPFAPARTLSGNMTNQEALRAGLMQKADGLSRLFDAPRAYVKSSGSGQSMKLEFDPRFLVFEFIDSKLLRQRQVDLVLDFLAEVQGGKSSVKQMIMGQGKTTVVSPLLALFLADRQRLVCLVVPSSLLDFTRTVLTSVFSTIIQKMCVTLNCDRSTDLDIHMSSLINAAKSQGNIVVSRPSDVKAIMLRLVENLTVLADPRCRRSTPELRAETVEVGKVLSYLQQGVCMIDEVDLILHPLKSELNFPIGQKNPIDLAPERWNLPLHLLSGFFCAENPANLPDRFKESPVALKLLDTLNTTIRTGIVNKHLQRSPHLVLLAVPFYHNQLLPVILDWLALYLLFERIGTAFDSRDLECSNPDGQRGLTEAEIKEFIISGISSGPELRRRISLLPAKDIQVLNLSRDWLHTFLPHVLQKIDRVTFGIMTDAQSEASLKAQPMMPITRTKLAIPFIGKDVPSPSSEYAHPDVVIGLTILAYKYEGIRKSDFEDILQSLYRSLMMESGETASRPSNLRWKKWIEDGGGIMCMKQSHLQEVTGEDLFREVSSTLTRDASGERIIRVLPLHLLERTNKAQMKELYRLLQKVPVVIEWYLQSLIFPTHLRFQDEKLSASGQDVGGSMLFSQRIGFSGTPSDLMPLELGVCEYEPGSEGQIIRTLTDPSVVTYEIVEEDWSVTSLLDRLCSLDCNTLIETGALITGLTNQETAKYLLGFDKPNVQHPTLPEHIEGVVFMDDTSQKLILVRKTGQIMKLVDCGIPPDKRFVFYDQIHTTGMDIQHKLDATAVLTLGKDMTLRDLAQGAYRMRGIGKGQRIHYFIIPEVLELIVTHANLAGHSRKRETAQFLAPEEMLNDVLAWLVINSMQSERIQYNMLQLQNVRNVWRKNAWQVLKEDYNQMVSPRLERCQQVFKDPVNTKVCNTFPEAKTFVEIVDGLAETFNAHILSKQDKKTVELIRANAKALDAERTVNVLAFNGEQEQEQEQEQEKEQQQEQEKEQEIEIEKFVDLFYNRDDEEPEPWELKSLANGHDAHPAFYPTKTFKLFKRRPLETLPEDLLTSNNYFNKKWSGFRRPKNVIMLLEWIPSTNSVMNASTPLMLNDAEEVDMRHQLHTAWKLLGGDKKGSLSENSLQYLLGIAFGNRAEYNSCEFALGLVGHSETGLLTAETMEELLLHPYYRPTDDGRYFVLVSLSEAETLRRVLHCHRTMNVLIPGVSLALRALGSNNEVFDSTRDFQCGPAYQTDRAFQVYRYFDGQTHYKDEEIADLMHGLQHENLLSRRMFFESLSMTRRRADVNDWRDRPIAAAFQLPLEFHLLVLRLRAVWLDSSLKSLKGLGAQSCFEAFNGDKTGLLQAHDVLTLLKGLGYWCTTPVKPEMDLLDEMFSLKTRGSASLDQKDTDTEIAQSDSDLNDVLDWVEAIQEMDQYLITYQEFSTFLKSASVWYPTHRIGLLTEETSMVGSQVVRNAIAHSLSKEDVVAKKLEGMIITRISAQKQHEAQIVEAMADHEEEVQLLIEEQVGTNPQCITEPVPGIEWSFAGNLLPRFVQACGSIDTVPDGDSYFLQADPKAFLTVTDLAQCQPNGGSDELLNQYTLTMCFRVPTMPREQMVLMHVEPEEPGRKDGAIVIRKDGSIGPLVLDKSEALATSEELVAKDLVGTWDIEFIGVQGGERITVWIHVDSDGIVHGGSGPSDTEQVDRILNIDLDMDMECTLYQNFTKITNFPIKTVGSWDSSRAGSGFHISMMVKCTDVDNWAGILSKAMQADDGNSVTKLQGWVLGFNGEKPGTLRFDVGGGSGERCTARHPKVITDGRWHRVEATVKIAKDTVTVKLSLDGQDGPELTVNSASNIACPSALMIGSEPFSGNRVFRGVLQNVVITSLADKKEVDKPKQNPHKPQLPKKQNKAPQKGKEKKEEAKKKCECSKYGAICNCNQDSGSSNWIVSGKQEGDCVELDLNCGSTRRILRGSTEGRSVFKGQWEWNSASGSFYASKRHDKIVAGIWNMEHASWENGALIWKPVGIINLSCMASGSGPTLVRGTALYGADFQHQSPGSRRAALDGTLDKDSLKLDWTGVPSWQGCSLTGTVHGDTLEGRWSKNGADMGDWRATWTQQERLLKPQTLHGDAIQFSSNRSILTAAPTSFGMLAFPTLACFSGSLYMEITVMAKGMMSVGFANCKVKEEDQTFGFICPKRHKMRILSGTRNTAKCAFCKESAPNIRAKILRCTTCRISTCFRCAGIPPQCLLDHGPLHTTTATPISSKCDRCSCKHALGTEIWICSCGVSFCIPCMDRAPKRPGQWFVKGDKGVKVTEGKETPFGEEWKVNDVIGILADFDDKNIFYSCNGQLIGGVPAFKAGDLNGDISSDPMLPILIMGKGAQLAINFGTRPFVHQPPVMSPEVRGMASRHLIRPHWKVTLAKEATVWAVFSAPSEASTGRRGLVDGEIIEELEKRDNWVMFHEGWTRLQGEGMTALERIPPWEYAKMMEKRVEYLRTSNFRPGSFKMLQKAYGLRSNVVHFEEGTKAGLAIGNVCPRVNKFSIVFTIMETTGTVNIVLGLCPQKTCEALEEDEEGISEAHRYVNGDMWHLCASVEDTEEATGWPSFFSQGHLMVNSSAGSEKEVSPALENGDQLLLEVDRAASTLRYSWNGYDWELVHSCFDKGVPSILHPIIGCKGSCTVAMHVSESMDDKTQEASLSTSSTKAPLVHCVDANAWHVATVSTDNVEGSMDIYLDGEHHGTYRNASLMHFHGPLAMHPQRGFAIFGHVPIDKGDWDSILGAHVKNIHLIQGGVTVDDVRTLHSVHGVWKCKNKACEMKGKPTHNPPEAKYCASCATRRIKTQPKLLNNSDGIHEGLIIVTAETFDELVINSSKPVFLLVSTTWCGPCVRLKPIWYHLANVLQSSPDITIAAMDGDGNQIPEKWIPENHVPVLKLFKRTSTDAAEPVPIVYEGGRDFTSMLQFLQETVGVSVSEVVADKYPEYRIRHDIDRLVGQIIDAGGLSADEAAKECPLAMRNTFRKVYEFLSQDSSESTREPLLSDDSHILAKAIHETLRRSLPSDPRVRLRIHALAQSRPVYDSKHFWSAIACRSFDPRERNKIRMMAWLWVAIFAGKLSKRCRKFARAIPEYKTSLRPAASMSPVGMQRQIPMIVEAMGNQNSVHILKKLLMRGYMPDGAAKTGSRDPPLLWLASMYGDLRAVQCLFAWGGDAHLPFATTGGSEYPTVSTLPIEVASAFGWTRVVEFLSKNGSVLGSALHHAAWNNQCSTASLLLEMGANPLMAVHGFTPLTLAIIRGHGDSVSLLLRHLKDQAVNVLTLSAKATSSLALAKASSSLHVAGALGHTGIVTLLMSHAPALLHAKNEYGQLPIDVALHRVKASLDPNHFEMFSTHISKFLPSVSMAPLVAKAISTQAHLGCATPHGWDILMIMAILNDSNAFKAVIDHSPEIYGQGKTQWTPALWARWMESESVLHTMANKGLRGTVLDVDGFHRLAATRAKASAEDTKDMAVTSLLQINKNKLCRIFGTCYAAPSAEYIFSSLRSRMMEGPGQARVTHYWFDDIKNYGNPHTMEDCLKELSKQSSSPSTSSPKPTIDHESLIICGKLFVQQRIAEASPIPPAELFTLYTFQDPHIFSHICTGMTNPTGRHQESLVVNVHRSLALLPPVRGRPLFCGLDLDATNGAMSSFLRGGTGMRNIYRPGTTIRWPTYTTATLNPTLTLQSVRGPKRVLFKIRRSLNAKDVSSYSPSGPHVGDVVLNPTNFRVVSLHPICDEAIWRGLDPLPRHLLTCDWSIHMPGRQYLPTLGFEQASEVDEVLILLDEELAAEADG